MREDGIASDHVVQRDQLGTEASRRAARSRSGVVKGRRLPDGFLRFGEFRPGDYQVVTAGSEYVLGLWVFPPGGDRLIHLQDRRYSEDRDGALTVEGTIETEGGHWVLERGLWRPV